MGQSSFIIIVRLFHLKYFRQLTQNFQQSYSEHGVITSCLLVGQTAIKPIWVSLCPLTTRVWTKYCVKVCYFLYSHLPRCPI